tara:strand:+ start:1188 stop:1556 length:369 start_codon:yes stop_codon:yes gene_type:complete
MASYEKNVAETNVSKWLEFKKAIKTHQKKINELKSAQKLVENLIISSMKSNEIPEYQLQSGGSLELVTKKSKKSVTPKQMKEKLTKCLGSNDTHETKEMIKKIMSDIEHPPITEKESLVHKN